MDKTYRASRSAPSVLASPGKLSLVVTLSDSGISYTEGIITKHSEIIPYDKINSVNVQQGPLQASLGYGDVIIETGNDAEPIVLTEIEHPDQLRDDVMAMVDRVRTGQAAPAAVAPSPEDEVEKLAKLRDEGIITADQFEQKKNQLLGL